MRIAIVGATGLVGTCMREILVQRGLPTDGLRLLASKRSAGQTIEVAGRRIEVEALEDADFAGVDVVLSSTPGSVSKTYSPKAAAAGAVVIDNSSAFRTDPDVPLVVPEVNADAIAGHQGIIANPNCSTIQMVVALKPLHDLAGLKRIVVSTYQASGGKGQSGLDDFDAQAAAAIAGRTPTAAAHRHVLWDDCLCDDWTPGDDGATEEETKMVRETKKIFADDSIAVVATCVRVPVRIGHSESVNVEFHRPITVQQARDALRDAPGVRLLDDLAAGQVPRVAEAVGRDETLVGRIRQDRTVPHGLNLWVVADNLRKGAALNAVQIAERLAGVAV